MKYAIVREVVAAKHLENASQVINYYDKMLLGNMGYETRTLNSNSRFQISRFQINI